MKLEFENSNGERKIVGTPNTIQEAMSMIQSFLKERNFKSYYTRINFSPEELEIDVGSHTEFFYLSELDVFDWRELGRNLDYGVAKHEKG